MYLELDESVRVISQTHYTRNQMLFLGFLFDVTLAVNRRMPLLALTDL